MPRDFLLLALGSCLAVACAKPAEAPPASSAAAVQEKVPTAQPQPAPPQVAPAAETPKTAPAGPRFWIAGAGLRAYDLNGTEVASLGVLGDSARRLADGRVVVVAASPLGARLSVLDPAGTPGVAVELPTVLDGSSCAVAINVLEEGEDGETSLAHEGLAMQSERDFAINAAGTHACIGLLDRNENMSDYEVEVAVELATGRVESAVGLDLSDHCPQTSIDACKDHAPEQVWAEGVEAVTAKSWTYAYDDETGVLSRAAEPVRELCTPEADRHEDWEPSDGGCLSTEEVSSSGRWLLVSAMNDVGGDYIYRVMYLLDLETAGLSSMICKDDGPCAIHDVEPEQLFTGDPPVGYEVVGETEVGGLPGDRFWIDGKLLIPADAKVVEIGGTRALSVGP